MASSPISPFSDPAEPILRQDATIPDEDKASLWDAFHTKNANELAQHLQTLAIPDDTKKKLFDAKTASEPAPEPIDKVSKALGALRNLDPVTLKIAEEHPQVMKAYVTAATAPEKSANVPEKGAEASSGASKPGGKGKTAAANADATETAPTMTPDIPVTPPGHALVQTSDYALHHLPNIAIPEAKKRDPRLQVLHVEP